MNQREYSITLPHSGLQLAVLEWGDAEARPILAFHGWLDNAASFTNLAPLLTGYRLIAVEWPGHGFSAHKPAGATYHFTDYILHLREIQAAIGNTPTIILGHSLGAAVASMYAACYPHLIDKLILIEGLGPVPAPEEESFSRLLSHVTQNWALADKSLTVYPSLEIAIKTRLKATPMKEESARLLVSRGLKSLDKGFVWRSDPRLTLPSPLRWSEKQVRPVLEQLQRPAILIKAENGMLHDKAVFPTAERESWVPNLRVITMSGQHHLHLDEPEPVATAILTFLNATVRQ